MLIREIRKEDNEKIKGIIKNSLESLGLAIPGTAYFDPQLDDLHHFYSQLSNAQYWVLEMDNEIVGGIGIAPFIEEQRICELQKLYLIPQAQGLGLSKLLMETALNFASKYYDKCYLETMHELRSACILYDKYGFQLLKKPLLGSEHSAMDAWYLKDLTQR